MPKSTFSAIILALVVAAHGCTICTSHAQDFPSKTVRIIVGFAPGGSNDLVARLIAPKLSEYFDKQVIIENRPGANAIIGTDLVAKASPDGHTLGLVGVSNLILNPLIYPKVPYAVSDFRGLTTVGMTHQVITVHPSLGTKTLKEFVTLAKARPGQLNFASSGFGGLKHLLVEMLNDVAKIQIRQIAYKGGSLALTDVISGQVHGVALDIAAPYPHIKQGKLRALAVTSESRASLLPEVPTAVEQGVNVVSVNWFAVVAPVKTPRHIVERLHSDLAKASKAPDIKDRFSAVGVEPISNETPEAFASFVLEEYSRWSKIVKQSKIVDQV